MGGRGRRRESRMSAPARQSVGMPSYFRASQAARVEGRAIVGLEPLSGLNEGICVDSDGSVCWGIFFSRGFFHGGSVVRSHVPAIASPGAGLFSPRGSRGAELLVRVGQTTTETQGWNRNVTRMHRTGHAIHTGKVPCQGLSGAGSICLPKTRGKLRSSNDYSQG
jgi:hypothetical protein